jgi:hypothetical protein
MTSITWGVTVLPLNRNLVSRFMKGGGAQETMKNNPRIDAKQGVRLVGSERYASPLYKVKWGLRQTREVFDH